MRLFGFGTLLCVFIASFTSTYAMGDAEICAQALQDYGIAPEECLTDEAAPKPQQVSENSLSDEARESHIFFDQGGSALSKSAKAQIFALGAVLETEIMKTACIRLIGHSDSSGGASANQALGLRRAEAVAEALRLTLENPERIREVISLGETQPLSEWPSSSPMNRRVEIQAKTCS